MKPRHASGTPRAVRGAAALTVVAILLFLLTLALLFVNRGLLVEQKTSASQYRSARALEAAEAGLDWAAARLNDLRTIGSACTPDITGTAFRARYLSHEASHDVSPDGSPGFAPPPDAIVACRLADPLVCHCPAPGTPITLPADDGHPHFRVQFDALPGEPEAVQLTAWGCSSAGRPCLTEPAHEAEAHAVLQVTLTASSSLGWLPAAALTTGGPTALAASATLRNHDFASGGLLLHAGAALAGPTPILDTLPGTPAMQALRQDDPALRTAALSAETWFAAALGRPLTSFRTAPTTHVVQGASAEARAQALLDAHDAGLRHFWVEGDLAFPSGTRLGSAEAPVAVVSDHALQLATGTVVHGLLHTASQQWEAVTLHGAVLAREHFHGQGPLRIEYDAALLATLQRHSASLLRVPGSWMAP